MHQARLIYFLLRQGAASHFSGATEGNGISQQSEYEFVTARRHAQRKTTIQKICMDGNVFVFQLKAVKVGFHFPTSEF